LTSRAPNSWVGAHYPHNLLITDKRTNITTKQKHYNFGPKWQAIGETYWTTYRYQLEAFVMKVRGLKPPHWIDLEESVEVLGIIGDVYAHAGLPARGLKHE
jgi:hypothetical protein